VKKLALVLALCFAVVTPAQAGLGKKLLIGGGLIGGGMVLGHLLTKSQPKQPPQAPLAPGHDTIMCITQDGITCTNEKISKEQFAKNAGYTKIFSTKATLSNGAQYIVMEVGK